MKIQLNTDAHIAGNEAYAARIRGMIEQALAHFSEHVTRVEVHLGEQSAGATGQPVQRCMLEARLEGRQPVAVTDQAATIDRAVTGAAAKLARLLEHTLGRLHDHREKTADLPLPTTPPGSH